MLEISSLCAGYGKRNIIESISLECPSGSITSLLGPNGCGKSTLLKAVSGAIPLSGGGITVNGQNVKNISGSELAQKIAYLPQGKNIPDITAARMVLHGRFPYLSYPRRYRKEDYSAARKAMEEMGISDLADKNMITLSGGMRQKVYIAMALCQQTDIIMLDEPATYLDIKQQLKLNGILRRLAEKGKTVLTVSHDIISALKYSDYLAVMENGRLKFRGTAEELLASGTAADVFGVGIDSVLKDGKTEYFYKTEVIGL